MLHRPEPFVTDRIVFRSIRQPKDVKILKPYLLLLWLERWPLRPDGFFETRTSVCEGFSGIEMGNYPMDLTRMLDQFLERSDHEQGSPGQEMEDQHCSSEALEEAEKKASDIQTGTHSRIIFSFNIFTQVTRTGSHSTFVCALPLMPL